MLTYYHYGMVILLMMTGLYIVIAQDNLIRKLIGLNLFQVSVFVLYISLGYLRGGTAPVLAAEYAVYASPLPHVLILTAIVVGISTMAVGLALVVRIYQAFGTIREDELRARQRRR
ncbi:MAG: cation:proton antiporter subunit C [Gammaproteobacteria bacterium]|nr:cation:proton antiporter subunit C [Gammaproteobacteria bacterium]MDD9824128.1 cation:proton antiporter subunit C [Gammaproteobacteria bacterium]MDD9863136.1 cation:proton antiporter subunit C [Gammaproteobacteria bacterium]